MTRPGTTACPACGADAIQDCVVTPALPVLCNAFPAERSAALVAPRAAMDLVSCRRCGHLFNRSFDPGLLRYDASYETSLHHSPQFRAWAAELAATLARDLPRSGATIAELGCGRGEFLMLFAGAGRRCLGFDRSYDGRLPSHAGLQVLAEDYEPARHGPLHADLVICRHVLEHLADPLPLGLALRAAAAPHGRVYLEVPNGLWTMRDGGIWDLIYEHFGYFTPRSLAALARRAGLAVRRVGEAYGGQFLQAELALDPAQHADDGAPLDQSLPARFASSLRELLASWSRRLAKELDAGRRIAVWGAGSKGVTFLNALPRGAEIELVVDRNPQKRGRHVPGTGQRIVSPAELATRRPELVLVMNPLYVAEIAAELESLGVRCAVEAVS